MFSSQSPPHSIRSIVQASPSGLPIDQIKLAYSPKKDPHRWGSNSAIFEIL
jgi:hypothetical protein